MAIVGAVVIAAIRVPAEPVGAHVGDLGFKWFSSSASQQRVANYASGAWAGAIINAVDNWNSQTVLSTNNYQSALAEIKYYSGNYGNSNWLGNANFYSGSLTCVSPTVLAPGSCNKTTNKANFSSINLNDYYWTPWNGNYAGFPPPGDKGALYERQRTAAHELGHVFGLNHPSSCSWGELMNITGCWFPNQPPTNGVTFDDAQDAIDNQP